MVDPNPIETTDSPIATAPRARVYTRAKWDDEWEERPFLECASFDLAVSPSIPEADFWFRFGEGLESTADDPAFGTIDPLDILHHYVKVELPQTAYGASATHAGDPSVDPEYWYGVIEEVVVDHQGSVPSGPSTLRTPNGWQRFRAFGLAFLLDRKQITTSWVFDRNELFEVEVKRAIAFNAGLGDARDTGDLRGNRSNAQGNEETYLFAGEMTGTGDTESEEEATSNRWNALQILEHLLNFHQPRDADGAKIFDIQLDPDGQHENLQFDEPIVATEGRTLKGLLDQLIARQRGHCWLLVVNENEEILLQVRPSTSEVIALEDGREITPNQVQHELDFEIAIDIPTATTNESLSHAYDQVVVRGARRGCCFTVSPVDGTLEAAWSESLEEEYETAATEEDDYAGLAPDDDDPIKVARNAQFRTAPKFDSVYSWFRVPKDWDFQAGDGHEGAQTAVCPDLNDGTPESLISQANSIEMWRPGLRFTPRLPLEKGVDYSEDAIQDRITGDPPRPPDPNPLAEYLPVSAYIRLQEDDDVSADPVERFARVDKSATPEQLSANVIAKHWQGSTMPLETQLGVEINVGKQWLLAKEDFDAAEQTLDGNLMGIYLREALDWRTLRVTGMMEADEHIEAAYPSEVPDPEAGDTPRILVIDVGDRCRLDYVAPGTWVGLRDGVPLKSTTGGFVRDDRHILRSLARLAGAWYLTERRAFHLVYRQVRKYVDPGDLIVTISQGGSPIEVNAQVTRVRYDLESQTTTIETDFAELDLFSFVPR